MNSQVTFFEKIIERSSSKKECVKELRKVLNLGKSALYRRINGSTALTIEEAGLLADYFNISLDSLKESESEYVRFQFSAFDQPIKSPTAYLYSLREQLQAINAIPNPKVYYASSEIPVFYYAFFPNLLKFKLYVWGRSIWNIENLMNRPFTFDILPPEADEIIDEILDGYTIIDSVELWSLNVLHNTINQIDFHLSSGLFEQPETALQLTKDLNKLVKHLKLMSEIMHKTKPESPEVNRSSFKLFHNEMIYTNNTILFLSDRVEILFSVLSNPNFIKTQDPAMIKYKKQWFNLLMTKSQLLSGQSEKNRTKFFNHLSQRIESSRKLIEIQLE